MGFGRHCVALACLLVLAVPTARAENRLYQEFGFREWDFYGCDGDALIAKSKTWPIGTFEQKYARLMRYIESGKGAQNRELYTIAALVESWAPFERQRRTKGHLRDAMALGSSCATSILGKFTLWGNSDLGENPDPAGAEPLLKQAASQGDAQAMFYLGLIYMSPDPRLHNRDEAIRRFQVALDWRKYWPAAAPLGELLLYDGPRTADKDALAARYLPEAAQYDIESAFIYAAMLMEGRGVPKDEATGRYLFHRLADLGHPGAQQIAQALDHQAAIAPPPAPTYSAPPPLRSNPPPPAPVAPPAPSRGSGVSVGQMLLGLLAYGLSNAGSQSNSQPASSDAYWEQRKREQERIDSYRAREMEFLIAKNQREN